jgi:hypothetical protein
MDRLVDHLRELGIVDVAVSAMIENEAARRFYAGRGFAPREVMHYRFGNLGSRHGAA